MWMASCMIETSYEWSIMSWHRESWFLKRILLMWWETNTGFLSHGTDTFHYSSWFSRSRSSRHVRGRCGLFQSGINLGDKEPLEYYKSVIRPDRYTFVVYAVGQWAFERTFGEVNLQHIEKPKYLQIREAIRDEIEMVSISPECHTFENELPSALT